MTDLCTLQNGITCEIPRLAVSAMWNLKPGETLVLRLILEYTLKGIQLNYWYLRTNFPQKSHTPLASSAGVLTEPTPVQTRKESCSAMLSPLIPTLPASFQSQTLSPGIKASHNCQWKAFPLSVCQTAGWPLPNTVLPSCGSRPS